MLNRNRVNRTGLIPPFCILAMVVSTTLARNDGPAKSGNKATSTPASAPAAFPQSWEGVWKGPCDFVTAGGKRQAFEMELHIAPTKDPSRFTWTLVYGTGDRRQERPYDLIVVDASNGRYVIDEKNSIKIESTFIGDTLYNQFALEKVKIVVSYRLKGETMMFDLVSFDSSKPTETGGEGEVPTVTTWPVEGRQRAFLKRVDAARKDAE